MLQWNALAVLLGADALADELLRDVPRQLAPVALLDEVQHEVQGAHPAGAGVAVAVDHEQALLHMHLWKDLPQAGEVLPVNGATVAVEQAGGRQGVAAGAKGAEGPVAFGEAAQQVEQLTVAGGLHPDAAADE